jgi:hypothetical protein
LANEFLIIYPNPPKSINGKKLWMRDMMQGLRWFHAETDAVVLSRYTVGIWQEPCFMSGALPAIAGNSVGSSNRTMRIPAKSYHPGNPPDEWFLAPTLAGPAGAGPPRVRPLVEPGLFDEDA